MLSRLDDVRVFQSSEDVIFSTSKSHHPRFKPIKTVASQYTHNNRSHLSPDFYQENEGSSDSEDKEDEQLHPQHPYRMRKRVLHRAQLVSGAVEGRVLLPFRGQDTQQLEFVMLPTGDILPREDCPPGLELPAMAELSHSTSRARRIEYQGEEDFDSDNDEDAEKERWGTVKQRQVPHHREDRFVSSLSSSSPHSSSSFVADGDVSSGDESEASFAASLSSEGSRQDERQGRSTRRAQSMRQGDANLTNKRGNGRERSVAKTGRNGVRNSMKRVPIRALNRDNLLLEVDSEMVEHTRKHGPSSQAEDSRQADTAVAFELHDVNSRPTGADQGVQVSQAEDTIDWPTPRTKRSPKMKVSHLLPEDPAVEPKSRAPSNAKSEAKMVDRLELKLQNEKKRVLEKMTQLLEEQGKNQQLHARIEVLEAKLAAKDNSLGSKVKEAAREHEVWTQTLENEWADRVKALEEQLRQKDACIAQLERDKEQLKAALRKVKRTADDLEKDRRLNDKEMTLNKEVNQQKENPNAATTQQHPVSVDDEQSGALVFLKKRLRQREDELRQTHVKYVELKELCARQCVREADLQNFINEHRLRGNLIIRKKNDADSKNAEDNQAHVQDDHQSDLKVDTIASRGVNSYHGEDQQHERNSNEEFSDNQDDNADNDDNDDNDDYEEGEEYEYPVRAPKVFVKVGRDGIYEHLSPANSAVSQKIAADRSRIKRKTQQQQQQQRVERIRLTPSPSLSQRYERVPTPSSTTARRKKSTQQQPSQFHPAHSHATLPECPPGCGSRLSFNRKKATSGTQRTRAKRPVATATKGAVGVIRPWM